MGQLTTFHFILLLVVSESLQSGLIGQDYSLTNALLLVLALVGFDLGLSFVKDRTLATSEVAGRRPADLGGRRPGAP